MNFSDFQLQRARLLDERAGLLDMAETNLYRALERFTPNPAQAAEGIVHRCHLASQWVAYYGLPPETSRRAFISCGVRDSLRILFHHLAGKTCALWLPEDNYPVYHELAVAAGLMPFSFPTLPEIKWPQEPPNTAVAHEWLILTHPLKPRGRCLGSKDTANLKAWLAASAKRRVVLDTVYTLETRFDEVTLDLLATRQVILLHSLTKGWLHPRCFGIALMPAQDEAEWMPVFREQPPPQQNLVTARHLMSSYSDLPAKIAGALTAAQLRLREAVLNLQLQMLQVNGTSYLMPVKRRWEDLLEEGVLGIPASVFGSRSEDLTILSSLYLAT